MKKPFHDLYDDFFKTTTPAQKTIAELDQLNADMHAFLDNPSVTPTPYPELPAFLQQTVYGQNEAVTKLNAAIKRPFFLEPRTAILNTILLSGPRGSGKHTLVKTFSAWLYTQQILKAKDPFFLSLSHIPDQTTWIQDLYRALKTPYTMVVFEDIEQCQPIYLEQLTTLLTTGTLPLNERYVAQQKHWVNADRTLESELLDRLQANHQVVILLSDLSPEAVKAKLGQRLLSAIHDIVNTQPLSLEASRQIFQKDWSLVKDNLYRHFQTELSLTQEAMDNLAKPGQKDGYYTVLRHLERLSGTLTDYLLTHPNTPKLEISYQQEALRLADGHPLPITDDALSNWHTVDQALQEIIGLDNVKAYLRSLRDFVLLRQKRKAAGLKAEALSLHTIFTGNPGTGKTTIARLMAQYLKALGILENGHLVEVTRADLVAAYVGQTALKTRQVIEASLGGILFIDEAYALYRGKEDSFGLEAIDMLVKSMEDYKDRLVVILAGYTKEMNDFLAANSGLKSRFPNQIEFPDYQAEELVAIAQNIAKQKDYEIAADALPFLKDCFQKQDDQAKKTAGNGRLARNIVEKAILHQAGRVLQDPSAALTILQLEDFRA